MQMAINSNLVHVLLEKRAHYEKIRGMNARSHSNMIFFFEESGSSSTLSLIFFSESFISERENLLNVPLASRHDVH